jgi:hypothetical protein
MATVKQVTGTRTSLTCTGLSTLASANYITSSDKDVSGTQPLDVIVVLEVATTNTPSGNKQCKLFAQADWSATGSNFQNGPTSGTTTTTEPILSFLGSIGPMLSGINAGKGFSLAAAYGGFCPPYFRIVVLNDLGVALTSGALYTHEISATVA